MYELDTADRNIILELLHDGRTPASQLAERVGLSRPAVAERIEKLERAGVIRGTTVVVSPAAVGQTVTAFISARVAGSFDSKAEKAFAQLYRRSEVVEVHTVAGDDCYLLKIRTSSIPALNDIVSLLNGAPLNMSTRTTIVMETHCEKVGGIDLQKERA
jgi:Lrp/AsnC family transcriptional regulator, leucine-responsive regulatory protein